MTVSKPLSIPINVPKTWTLSWLTCLLQGQFLLFSEFQTHQLFPSLKEAASIEVLCICSLLTQSLLWASLPSCPLSLSSGQIACMHLCIWHDNCLPFLKADAMYRPFLRGVPPVPWHMGRHSVNICWLNNEKNNLNPVNKTHRAKKAIKIKIYRQPYRVLTTVPNKRNNYLLYLWITREFGPLEHIHNLQANVEVLKTVLEDIWIYIKGRSGEELELMFRPEVALRLM